jgi:hypothetical protein
MCGRIIGVFEATATSGIVIDGILHQLNNRRYVRQVGSLVIAENLNCH